jgi:hypothetical protein
MIHEPEDAFAHAVLCELHEFSKRVRPADAVGWAAAAHEKMCAMRMYSMADPQDRSCVCVCVCVYACIGMYGIADPQDRCCVCVCVCVCMYVCM